ncbi:MAG: branched-chain amino acid ABC transporter permease [Alphaproteobacteria bacterium]|nr:branched-chain amino acid ABC transporter permease [Alphaproteobacteria bacterium]
MDRTLLILLAVLAASLAGALAMPAWAVSLATMALAKALVVLGLVVLLRCGLVPFGQALFFALGAYGGGMALRKLGIADALLGVAIGTAVAGTVAFLLGFLMARYREIFFAMLSVAFSMIFYGALVKNEALGSTDGFNLPTPTFLGYAPKGEEMRRTLLAYTALVSVGLHALVHAYLASPLGRAATAIRDNEIRVEYLGASVQRLIHGKFVMAGALAGAGGILVGMATGHIDPEMSYWTTSGEFVFIAIMGGASSVVAAIAGSAVFEVVRTYALQYAPQAWQGVIGAVLLLIILFLPNGLWSLVERRRKRAAGAAGEPGR